MPKKKDDSKPRPERDQQLDAASDAEKTTAENPDAESEELRHMVTRALQHALERKLDRSRSAAREPGQHDLQPEGEVQEYALMPLRGIVLLPGTSMTFEVMRPGSLAAVHHAMEKDRLLITIPQPEPDMEWPEPDELGRIGCLSRIREVYEFDDRPGCRIRIEGQERAQIEAFTASDPCYLVEATRVRPPREQDYHGRRREEAYRRQLLAAYQAYSLATGRSPVEALPLLGEIRDPGRLTDLIISNLDFPYDVLIELLEELDVEERMLNVLVGIRAEIDVTGIERQLEERVRAEIDKDQRDYYLREQLKIIRDELGESDNPEDEEAGYLERLEKMQMTDRDREQLVKEIRRLSKYPAHTPDASVLRTYLELVFDLPWGKLVSEQLDIRRCRAQLERDHYGLKQVKERILEHIAVMQRRRERTGGPPKAPILCLVGPPGVGKTSVGQSIAKALGRPFVRMSLGGVHDEAEIRGHRRTYIGAMPGRIINAIRQARADNPLILMDEVDKLGRDFRGDPSSALLEVLDPEQNVAFRDHYLELDYNLSRVFFVTTANSTDTIPQPLLDRMELIELGGYTEEEKLHIARLHLWPKQMELNAISGREIRLRQDAILRIIRGWTREAGVRQLEQALARLCRRLALQLAENPDPEGEQRIRVIRARDLEDYLEKPLYKYDEAGSEDLIGVVNGLAWTAAGGDTLVVEVAVVPGSGRVELTGRLGDVMQESAKVALAWVRGHAKEWRIPNDFAKTHDIHVHVPEGAIPKDGPSAGITLVTALCSALAGRPARHDVAMTGEVTIRGRVLAIGGLKEKIIAAHRAGIRTVLIPEENRRDLDDIPASVLEKVEVIPISSVTEALEITLLAAAAENSVVQPDSGT
ncbi:MAG: endopeptidase La [Bacillota bacterium]|nr:endopeptidase La [Bacillota bacterium]